MNVLNILNSPWAITPEKLTEMCAIYAAHRNGESADLKAIEAALGKPLQPGGPKPYEVQDGVAIIPLEGVLSKRMSMFSQISGGQSYQSFISELQQAVEDPAAIGIIVTVDSPGGAVDGTQQAADAVYAARSVKPICTLVNGEMCSAAYWIGSAASQAYVSSDTDVVGSIGVVTQHVDTSAAEYLRGIKVTDVTAGKYKRIASQHAPLSPEGRGAIQDQLDHVYGVFVDNVARNRGTNAQTVLSKMADGRVFRGQQAIDAGLVDGKMTLPQLVQKMKSQTGTRNFARVPQTLAKVGATMKTAEVLNPIAAEIVHDATVTHMTAPMSAEPSQPPAAIAVENIETSKHTLNARLRDAIIAERKADSAVWAGTRDRVGKEKMLPLVEASSQAKSTVATLRAQIADLDRKSEPTPTERVKMIRDLKNEAITVRGGLPGAIKAEREAAAAVQEARRMKSDWKTILPHVEEQTRCAERVSSLRARLKAIDSEEFAILQGC